MGEAADSCFHDNQRANKETQHDDKQAGRYFPALVLVAAIIPLPFLAAFITIIAYLSPYPLPRVEFFAWLGSDIMVVIVGFIVTLVLWLLLAIPCMRFATARGARPVDYESLRREVDLLGNRLKILKEEALQANTDAHKKATEIAISDIQTDVCYINNKLNSQGLHWLNTGYISLWDRRNKADEALIEVLPSETVIESANLDKLCLTNSDVPNWDDLSRLLERAINTLRSEHATDSQKAIADIRKVKAALHKFTNERWDGLVRARNVLVVTAFLAALFTYMLVVTTILAEVAVVKIEEAMVFYFVGAIVGLFSRIYDENRIYNEKKSNNFIDDYGLTMARIIVTPLLSGLAALVGVFLVTILAITITSQYNAASTGTPTIGDIYNFVKYPQNLVFAAIFGYVPNLVINLLQRKSEDIKGQLESTNPANQSKGDSQVGKRNTNSVINPFQSKSEGMNDQFEITSTANQSKVIAKQAKEVAVVEAQLSKSSKFSDPNL